MQQFLIITPQNIFTTNYFDYENNYEVGMVIVNLYKATYTRNGKDWFRLPEDSL